MGDKPKIYIAGPMTGIEHFNYPAFMAARDHLIKLGYDAHSPTDSEVDDNGVPGSVPYQVYFKAGLVLMLKCDSLALLPGWTGSKGARREVMVALSCGMSLYRYLEGRADSPLARIQAGESGMDLGWDA